MSVRTDDDGVTSGSNPSISLCDKKQIILKSGRVISVFVVLVVAIRLN